MEFFWRAVYYDESTADQYDAEGEAVVRGYEDIDRERLMAFEIREMGTEKLIHRAYLGGDKRLIWRKRVSSSRLAEDSRREKCPGDYLRVP